MKLSKKLSALLVASSILMAACGEEATKEQENAVEPAQVETEKVSLSAEVEVYQQFAVEQMEKFVIETENFVNLFKSGDIEAAKAAYAPARMYFERSEPIAESFGDLDPRIDGRLADLEEEGQGKEEWSGYHKLEYALWVENTTTGYEQVADQLLADVKQLYALVQTVEVEPELLVTGAVDLLNEVSTSKITGEEEIYSHTDLYDFKANIEGAEKIFEILRANLEAKDANLVATLDEKFSAMNDLLAKYEDGKGGYVSYEVLTEDDTKALATAVNELGEPLSQMGIVIE
ncbi:iron uptake system protein EfeO [Lysinibacillus sp. KU-BSD001]|uniref:iron uptake system protein EfeO n=1 Tax=Lysinibacillus sp. KU-BSD001 TaxID=3141328 RepID=UPI0036E90624